MISMSMSYVLFQFIVKPEFLTGIGVAVVLSVIAVWLITRPEQPFKRD